ncbi:hypothetical protein C4588_05830 [Candidatus Parcubacteria bacterium]|nr:MAG: hypothetical protein C4588_05830 [Candidatus Parcubacteria bacterium]
MKLLPQTRGAGVSVIPAVRKLEKCCVYQRGFMFMVIPCGKYIPPRGANSREIRRIRPAILKTGRL